ncbi:MAG: hypothetical protein ACI94Y_002322 [Maribacter sp.]|jgi:hypothetical protein
MEEAKIKRSIRNAALLIKIAAGFIIFSNLMGTLSFLSMDISSILNGLSSEFELLIFIIKNTLFMSMGMVLIGILYFVGGIYLVKRI